MKITTRRRLAASVASVALALAGLFGTATAAQAASAPNCSHFGEYQNAAGQYAAIPSYLTSSGWYSHDCIVWPGTSYAGAVIKIQQSLNDCNGFNLVVDGLYGAQTQNALKTIQARNGLTQDGIYGPNTAKAMFWSFPYAYDCARGSTFSSPGWAYGP